MQLGLIAQTALQEPDFAKSQPSRNSRRTMNLVQFGNLPRTHRTHVPVQFRAEGIDSADWRNATAATDYLRQSQGFESHHIFF